MKTKSIFLPLTALVFAVFGAFATEIHSSSFINDPVVIDGDEQCKQVGMCSNNSPGTPCRNSSNQQLDVRQDGVTCSVPATGTFTPL